MAHKTTHLKIMTPRGIFFEGDVDIVTVKTTEGYIGLQFNHIPFVAALEISEMTIGSARHLKHQKTCAINGGLVYVTRSNVDIITEAIEFKENIDLIRAQEAKQTAEDKLQQNLSESEQMRTIIMLKKALNRIKIKGG